MSEQGTTGLIWRQPSYVSTPTGYTKTISAIGNHADALAIVDTYRAAGWNVNLTPIEGTPKSEVVASLLWEDTTTWELDVQWGNVDVDDCIAFKDYLDAQGTDALKGAKIIELFGARDEMRDSKTQTLYDALSSTDQAWVRDLLLNATQWEPSAVLRRVRVYPPNTTSTADWDYVNQVWSKTQIDSQTDAPNAIIGTLPTGSYWLKTSAGMQYSADGRVTVATHWIMGNYPSHRYTYKT